MDRARIEDISAKFSSKVGLASTDELIEFAEHIAKIARAEALEEAAVKAWSTGMDEHNSHQGLPHDCREVGSICAKEIRALKEKS